MARYTLPGRLKVYLLDAQPADLDAVTLAELLAGLEVQCSTTSGESLGEINGWELQASTIATPDYCSHVVGNVPGDSTYPDSSLTFYADDAVKTIYTKLAPGWQGFVVFAYDGAVAGEEAQTFGARVLTRVRRKARDAAHMYDVAFAVDAERVGPIAP